MTGAFGDPAPMTTQARLADRFEVGPIIGRGGMGTVHRGLDRETAATVATAKAASSAVPKESFSAASTRGELTMLQISAGPSVAVLKKTPARQVKLK